MSKRLLGVLVALVMALAITPTASAQDDTGPGTGHRTVEETPLAGTGGGSVQVPVMETQGADNTYVLLDSNDDHGPTPWGICPEPFTLITPPGNSYDDESFAATLPFDFTFYGTTYTSGAAITIGMNGVMAFAGGQTLDFANTDISSGFTPAIFPFWDDLQIHNDGSGDGTQGIYSCTGTDAGVDYYQIEWFRISCFDSCGGADSNLITAMMRLYTDGRIEFSYPDVEFTAGNLGNEGGSATIGIGSGTEFLQYSINQTSLAGNFAIRFWPAMCDLQPATQVGTRADDTGAVTTSVYYGHHGDDNIDFTGVRVCGGNGNDTLASFGSGTFLFGDEGPISASSPWTGTHTGNDTLNGDNGPNLLFGGPGRDTLNGNGGADAIYGFYSREFSIGLTLTSAPDGNDTLNGGSGDDVMFGDVGNDMLNGDGGDDIMFGGPDTDIMNGGNDNDEMYGNEPPGMYSWVLANFELTSPDVGDTDDSMRGGSGDDDMFGGPGGDRMYGQGGNDFIDGEAGDDKAWGGDDDDTIDGGDNNDVLRGNGGNDEVFGGPGDDRIYGNAGLDDLSGEAGDDRAFGGDDDDFLTGGIGNDSLFGLGGSDILVGNDDDDLLNGGTGPDLMFGEDGTDTMRGGSEDDFMDGGPGDNDLVVGQGGDDDLSGGDGIGDVCRGKSHFLGDVADATCETINTVP